MSRAAVRADDATAGLKVAGGLVAVLALSLVLLLLVRARPVPDPFDPRSGRPDGTRGLVVLLERFGGEVEVTRETRAIAADDRLLVLDDRLDDDQRVEVVEFAEAGGTVIVADPASSLHGGSGPDGGAAVVEAPDLADRRLPLDAEIDLLPGDCTIEPLAQLRGLRVPDGLLFPVGGTEPRCFTRVVSGTPVSFVVVRDVGAGTIVGLGDNEILTNRHLRRADNAGLATALLIGGGVGPGAGDGAGDGVTGGRVVIVIGNGAAATIDDLGSGEETLFSLVPPWVWMALTVLAAAMVVFAASAATRLGRVVTEPVAAPIAGSELVAATGNLMARAGHAAKAGWLVRSRLHRDLCDSLGVSPNAPLDEVDRVAARTAGTRPGEVEALLRAEAHGDADLERICDGAARLRRTVLERESVTT